MADYSAAERINILLILGECRRNYRQAAALYRNRYPHRRHPSHTTILDIYRRAQQGQLARVREHRNYDENDLRVMVVLAMVHLNPHISTREIQRQSGIPMATAWRILRNQRYHPYHITLTQDVTPVEITVTVLPMGTTNDCQ